MHIVKRKGHKEPYDERKIYASVYAACLTVRVPQAEAELVADKVSKEVSRWVRSIDQISSDQLATQVHESLKAINPDAAYMYRTHRDLS